MVVHICRDTTIAYYNEYIGNKYKIQSNQVPIVFCLSVKYVISFNKDYKMILFSKRNILFKILILCIILIKNKLQRL